MKFIFLFCILLLLPPVNQPQFTRVEVSKKITMLVPSDWKRLAGQELMRRFVAARPPLALYVSPDGLTDLIVNVSDNNWKPEDLELFRQFQLAKIKTLFDQVTILKDEVVTISKRKYVVFEFNAYTEAAPPELRKKYHHMQYNIVKSGRVLGYSFSCPEKMASQWKETKQTMMNSVKNDL